MPQRSRSCAFVAAVATYLSTDPATGEQRDVYQEVPGKTFVPQTHPTKAMVEAGITGPLMLMTRGSKFVKYQVRRWRGRGPCSWRMEY